MNSDIKQDKEQIMSNKREAKLWKELDWLRVLLAIAVMIILTIAYFYVSKWEVSTWRDFLLNIIASLIPTFLLFVLAYFTFRRIEELRSEKDADELADKVASRLIEIAQGQAGASGKVNNPIGRPMQFSKSHLKLLREFDVTVKPFEPKSSPQKLAMECTYRGKNIIRIRK